jgi:hypothetical protein
MPVLAFGQAAVDGANAGEPPMLGIHWVHGFNPLARAAERTTAAATWT